MADSCEDHAWASIGVTVIEGEATRLWACENCPAWSRQPLESEAEIDWADTWLAGR